MLSGHPDATADGLTGGAVRVVPLTGTDAGDLIRSGRAAPLLSGPPGACAAGLGTLEDMPTSSSRSRPGARPEHEVEGI